MIATNIALTGAQASVARINVSAQNVANANTTGETVKAVTAANAIGKTVNHAYQPIAIYQAAAAAGGVNAKPVPAVPGTGPRYDPESQDADADGNIEAPDVDFASEDVEQRKALFSFRANLSVIKTEDRMMGALLDMRV
ncbi:flagellar biosynthesis protein FlgC [Sphingomonas sp. ABOLD]|uniref:Flagellar basal-body rod protein FlgC n=1 Tax=Sphingomonas trueperi TaxID=53317 RepID=A0A7X5XZ24_9SPHN|nr:MULTISPECIES: flagellar biosynthesis protein FlgC [Sphingomonas]NJB96755.1 flagellar basal-body rod protein FlgC [Sphingomonas trueperi]RSV44333.1 flagellar biosynthesis protein FlgC [Sphingomonas sp. ABOLE]RSV51959.1 flagellar biosynthesis protein FlgC [Sphingomonas sp. ABOLD]